MTLIYFQKNSVQTETIAFRKCSTCCEKVFLPSVFAFNFSVQMFKEQLSKSSTDWQVKVLKFARCQWRCKIGFLTNPYLYIKFVRIVTKNLKVIPPVFLGEALIWPPRVKFFLCFGVSHFFFQTSPQKNNYFPLSCWGGR